MKIVINDCYGGPYDRAEPDCDCLTTYTFTKDLGDTFKKWPKNDDSYFYDRDVERTDEDLVAVVEMLGSEADGSGAELKVIEIPDDIDWEL